MIASSLNRALSLLVAATMFAAPLPALAAAPKKSAEPVQTDGKTVALMRFTGSEQANDLRVTLQPILEEGGYTVKGVALDLDGAAKKVKCKGDAAGDDCLSAVGKWLNANPKTASDFIVFGSVGDAPESTVELVVFDVANGKRVRSFDTAFNEGDLILPIVLPQELVTSIDEYKTPPAPATPEEQAMLAELDEPEKTPEEIAAEKEAVLQAEKDAAAALQDQVIDTKSIEADLKGDFDAFCRNEPRRKRKSKEDPKDLRPACKRGPFWGYWQPRAWVALGLTAGTALGAVGMYTMALVARGPYKDAVDELDAYNAQAGGDPRRDPNAAADGYDALATEVSRTGSIMRRRAIVGDVLLGTSVLLGGVLAIIIYQDRTDAKRFIKEEKSLRAISDLRVGPILTRETQGLGMGFRF
ncbi:MAG: hypothetical protein H6712_09255 [Myxococcales bacterium]|nr:hypothetical protein [Myxococcales bacterium]MCB9714029.1 hypothetical protein [Myxococcales bacterium]